jgi:hypothetical protein
MMRLIDAMISSIERSGAASIAARPGVVGFGWDFTSDIEATDKIRGSG